jgi:hypothetical protein
MMPCWDHFIQKPQYMFKVQVYFRQKLLLPLIWVYLAG